MIVALHSVLHAGRESDYDAVHARIPDDLLEAHRKAGILDWHIWRSGRDLFHLVECADFASAMRDLENDPANERWQAFIGPYVERSATPLSLVWSMCDEEGTTQRRS